MTELLGPTDWSVLDELEADRDQSDWSVAGTRAVAAAGPRRLLGDARPVRRPSVEPTRRKGFGEVAPLRAEPVPAVREADRKAVVKHRDDSLKARLERPRCKARPRKSAGGGGSRSFIPWCEARR